MAFTCLKKRREFLHVASKGHKFFTPHFILQFLPHSSQEAEKKFRYGLTVTKKTGNAVVRNRIKRRLRAAFLDLQLKDSVYADIVIIAKKSCVDTPFDDLKKTILFALSKVKKLKSDS